MGRDPLTLSMLKVAFPMLAQNVAGQVSKCSYTGVNFFSIFLFLKPSFYFQREFPSYKNLDSIDLL